MNNLIEIYDQFIRNDLKNNKVDISLLNWIAQSLAACREIKWLCTKIFKKKTKKPLSTPIPQQLGQPWPPSYQYGGQVPFTYQYRGSALFLSNIPVSNIPATSNVSVFSVNQSSQKTLHVEAGADNQTRRLMKLLFTEKIFRILCMIQIDVLEIFIDRKEIQTDQKFDMNVIFI